MNLKQLHYFVKVVEAGNMTRAAARLHVAQPAIGVQLAQLESNLGVKLLTRHSRGVVPTLAGEKLFHRAMKILQDVDDVRAEIRQQTAPGPEFITMGIAPSVMFLLGSEILRLARESAPRIALSVIEQPSFTLVEGVARNEIDVALVYADPVDAIKTPILSEELLFVAAPARQPDTGPIRLADALKADLALGAPRDPCRQLIEAASREISMNVKITYEAQSNNTMKDLALRDLAACIMPFGTVCNELEKGALIARRIQQPAIKRTLYLLRSRRRPIFQNEIAFQDVLAMTASRLRTILGPYAIEADDVVTADGHSKSAHQKAHRTN
jgi:LysR family nitrogen assimilation transcriptional regulator